MFRTAITTLLAGLVALPILDSAKAQADGVRQTTCAGGRFAASCITTWRYWEPSAPEPPTQQEIAESRERDRQWQARCRPVIKQDEFGVARYTYAASGCEYGKIQ